MSAENCPKCFGPAGDRTDRICDGCRDKQAESMETPGSTAFIGNIPMMIGQGLPEIHRLYMRGGLQKTWDYLNRDPELQTEFKAVLDLIVDWARMREAFVEQRALKYGIGPTAPVMEALNKLKAVIADLEGHSPQTPVPGFPDSGPDMLRKLLTCTCDADPNACPIPEHEHTGQQEEQWTKKERMGIVGYADPKPHLK